MNILGAASAFWDPVRRDMKFSILDRVNRPDFTMMERPCALNVPLSQGDLPTLKDFTFAALFNEFTPKS
jgi:hypothetical protein